MMNIDGYVPADPKTATEIGVELEYTTNYGQFFIRTKSSGSLNTGFQKAAEKLATRRSIREKTGYKPSAIESLKETLGIWHDEVIISWNTTVKADGKKIEPSRDTFIELFSMEVFLGVFSQLATDAGDLSLFTKEAEAAAAKN